MFEDATFDSRAIESTQTSKWMLLTLAVNLSVLAALVAMPLFYPASLPARLLRQSIEAPPSTAASHPRMSETISAPKVSPVNLFAVATAIPRIPRNDPGTPPPMQIGVDVSNGQGAATGSTSDAATVFRTQPPAVAPAARPSKIAVSGGVTEGLLISRIAPVYPPIALAAHVSGIVILAATISRTGVIEDLHVLSGSAMLRQAAIDAVQRWRYRPYLLNGEPVEVETTIHVVFSQAGR